ncbi:MAG: alpha/beta hydrolase [Bacteroidetes bacterium]|nr:alpha/beta hydrolase [Bacteroidota bacterium]
MTVYRNIAVGQSKSKTLYIDAYLPESGGDFDTAVFFHGTKGFKNWGAWPFMAPFFNHENIALVTVGFSHNGLAAPDADTFDDPAAYASNTISLELAEMKMVIDWLEQKSEEWKLSGLFHLIGHSRAGGEVLIYACRDQRIDKVITWATIDNFLHVFRDFDREKWKEDGAVIIKNQRTGQELPVNYTFLTDVEKNQPEFNILKAASIITNPLLLIHGNKDDSVSIQCSKNIYENCLHSILVEIENANHVFGLKHPWAENAKFPREFIQVLDNTVDFIKG